MRLSSLFVAVPAVRLVLGLSVVLSVMHQPAQAQQSTPPKIK